MKLVGIAGSLASWKTNVAVHTVLTEARRLDSTVETELIDLRDFEVEFANGNPLAYFNQDTFNVVNKVMLADALVFGTPIYQASITGALKNLLDHLEPDAFKGKVTGMITTGAVEKHFLVAEYQLKPILSYLKGLVPTGNAFIHNDSYNDENEIIDRDAFERMHKLAAEVIQLQKSLG
ncbi:NADPH-dependent FMN reductase [Radiobacillus sp. PE A8.2]|uniref:NADPH-dependent FMN reductase n=1 Tax=Radiobacillus sp. PE A8.2 TaxID=3380349 RepID=UPI00388F16F5